MVKREKHDNKDTELVRRIPLGQLSRSASSCGYGPGGHKEVWHRLFLAGRDGQTYTNIQYLPWCQPRSKVRGTLRHDGVTNPRSHRRQACDGGSHKLCLFSFFCAHRILRLCIRLSPPTTGGQNSNIWHTPFHTLSPHPDLFN